MNVSQKRVAMQQEAVRLIRAGKTSKLRELLTKYGVDRVSEMPDEVLTDALAEFQRAGSLRDVLDGLLEPHMGWVVYDRRGTPKRWAWWCRCGAQVADNVPYKRVSQAAHLADVIASAGVVVPTSEVEALADKFAAFDVLEDDPPSWVDVPEDYEGGLLDASRELRALVERYHAQ